MGGQAGIYNPCVVGRGRNMGCSCLTQPPLGQTPVHISQPMVQPTAWGTTLPVFPCYQDVSAPSSPHGCLCWPIEDYGGLTP